MSRISYTSLGVKRKAYGANSKFFGVSPHPSRLTIIYARISVTTPEPTVLPPSRTANRNP